MTPEGFDMSYAHIFSVNSSNALSSVSHIDTNGVRPVINLKSTTEIIEGGNGTQSNPYVIS